MVSTPSSSVARCVAMLCITRSASNTLCSTSVMPQATAEFITTLPYTCEHGSALTTVSAAVRTCIVAVIATLVRMPRCVSTAHLGWPVVPEV